MSEKVTSRLAGFHKLPFAERLNQIGRMFQLTPEELEIARGEGSLAHLPGVELGEAGGIPDDHGRTIIRSDCRDIPTSFSRPPTPDSPMKPYRLAEAAPSPTRSLASGLARGRFRCGC